MKASELNLYGNNASKDPPLFITLPASTLLYIERDDFLSMTGMKEKRLDLYLLRHKEIRTLLREDKKYLGLQEMLLYLAKLQRSGYGKNDKKRSEMKDLKKKEMEEKIRIEGKGNPDAP